EISRRWREQVRGVSEDGRDAPGLAIGIDEGGSLDAIVALPIDDEGGIVFFDVDGFGVAVAGQPCGELIGRVEQPGAGCSGPRRRGESSSPPPSVCLVDAGSPFDPCRVSRGLPWICSPSCSATSWSPSITAS